MTKKLACLGIVSLCLFLLLHPDRTVSAHVFLKSSQPASEQILSHAPAQVVLVFSGVLSATGNQIAVTDAAGKHFETGGITFDSASHATMTIALKPLPDGVYTVSYTALSDTDGHETVDNFRFGVGSVTLVADTPSRACAMLPTITAQADKQTASVRIVSPADNSTLTSSHLDYSIETRNFALGSNGNFADVYVDGQKVQKVESIGGHSLDLAVGIHDVCIALVDGANGTEVGARAGVRLSVSSNAATPSSGSSPLGVVALIFVVVTASLVTALLYWRRRVGSAEDKNRDE